MEHLASHNFSCVSAHFGLARLVRPAKLARITKLGKIQISAVQITFEISIKMGNVNKKECEIQISAM